MQTFLVADVRSANEFVCVEMEERWPLIPDLQHKEKTITF